MAASNDPIEQKRLETLVGNPAEKLQAIKDRIQGENLRTFKEIEADFLDLLWSVDTYRVERVVPRAAVGTKAKPGSEGGEGIYRTKGNFFSEVITAILSNKTTSMLAPRSKVQGFSQTHQIDIAWPSRNAKVLVDPLICCEAKLTGAPAYEDKPARKGLADWTNRRKELKFQATDLKLYRQAANTKIHNWDQWRRKASPLVYTLWAARLVDLKEFTKMVSEAQALTATYSDGVGIFGFVVNPDENGYVAASPATAVAERVTSLDTVLNLIAAEIQSIMDEHDNKVPPPVVQKNIHASSLPDTDADDSGALF